MTRRRLAMVVAVALAAGAARGHAQQAPARNDVEQQVREAIQQAQQAAREAQAEARQASREAQQQAREAQQQAREAQVEAQTAAREAQIDAQQAAREAGQGGVIVRIPAPPGVPMPPDAPRIFNGPAGGGTTVQTSDTVPPEVVTISIAFFIMLAAIIIMLPVARAFSRRMDRRSVAPARDPDVTSRLERIEQAVESVAIEVERISEAQRFQAKLASDQRALPSPNGADALDVAAIENRAAQAAAARVAR